MRRTSRRVFLATISIGVSSLAGCASIFGDEDSIDAVRPRGEPPAIPSSLACSDGSFQRLRHQFDEDTVSWGSLSDPPVELRVSRTELTFGDDVVVRLTNVGTERIGTGVEEKFALQLRTEAGWEEVRGTPDGIPIRYPDLLVHHDPGEGFEWTFRLTADGITDDSGTMVVCPSLRSGRYRFVYLGVGEDAGVAVAFDVE